MSESISIFERVPTNGALSGGRTDLSITIHGGVLQTIDLLTHLNYVTLNIFISEEICSDILLIYSY